MASVVGCWVVSERHWSSIELLAVELPAAFEIDTAMSSFWVVMVLEADVTLVRVSYEGTGGDDLAHSLISWADIEWPLWSYFGAWFDIV